MNFEQLRASWEELGAKDPFWAILSEAGRGLEQGSDASFWLSGQGVVDFLVRHLGGLEALPRTDQALDFGCGIGRLTQALARHFGRVVGVDIAESMLDRARAVNRNPERVTYVHNARADLSSFADDSFDFVVTMIVLQHMRPEYALGYLREFLRVLRPGGVLVFQLPIEPFVPVEALESAGVASTGVNSEASILRAFTSILPPNRHTSGNQWLWWRIEVFNPGPDPLLAGGANAVEIGLRFQRTEGSVAGITTWVPLARDVVPGARETVVVPVLSPATPGPYLVYALPCRRRRWIAHSMNVPAAGVIIVEEGRSGPIRLESPPKPIAAHPDGEGLIEVYGIPLPQVCSHLERMGAEIVDVSLDEWAGEEWLSAHFVVRKEGWRPCVEKRS